MAPRCTYGAPSGNPERSGRRDQRGARSCRARPARGNSLRVLIRPVRGPNFSIISATAASDLVELPNVTGWTCATRPRAAFDLFLPLRSGFPTRPHKCTSEPCSARCLAIPLPSPVPPPVIRSACLRAMPYRRARFHLVKVSLQVQQGRDWPRLGVSSADYNMPAY